MGPAMSPDEFSQILRSGGLKIKAVASARREMRAALKKCSDEKVKEHIHAALRFLGEYYA